MGERTEMICSIKVTCRLCGKENCTEVEIDDEESDYEKELQISNCVDKCVCKCGVKKEEKK